ncbi:MAG: paraquat-inducible protein A [Proteobacteria bacterium]|nr:MAG: paraquat-inducible protein A [Pseudomonadota bacterium]
MSEETYISCKVCHLVHPQQEFEEGYAYDCERCGHEVQRRTPYSLHLTLAFALSALFFYLPANLFPILRMSMFGRTSENTIISGVFHFYEEGDYFVAIVVFLASVLIPFLKILAILLLVFVTWIKKPWVQTFRTKLYLAVETLGRWAMLDVFAVAVLISLIKLGNMATVIGGKGAGAFVLVVIFTVLASASFDSHLIWKDEYQK